MNSRRLPIVKPDGVRVRIPSEKERAAKLLNPAASVAKILRLRDGGETTINGVLWCRMDYESIEDGTPIQQWKVSPYPDDVDRNAYWIELDELSAQFGIEA